MGFTTHWRRLALAIGGAVLLFAAYGQVLTRGPFGINDDYQYLYRVHQGTFDPAHNEQTGMGRPAAAWGFEILYGLCDGKVARLVRLRAFALAGVGLFAWTLFATLRGLRYSQVFAGTVAALVALSPACGVYAAWAAAMFSTYALSAALLAGRLFIGPADRWRAPAGFLLFVLACMVWQAAAPMAVFPALMAAWRRTGRRSEPPPGSPWWRPWLMCGIAAAVYALLCRVTFWTGLVSGETTQRLTLSTDFPAKARLFVTLLRIGVTSWARLQPGFWEWTVGSLTVAACLSALVNRRGGRIQWTTTCRRLGLAAVMVLVSVLPLLAAREDNAAFRSLSPLYTVVAFLCAWGLRGILSARQTWVRIGVPLIFMAADAGAARYHVWHGLVEPNLREYVGIRDQVRRQFPGGPPARLVYLVPPYTILGEEHMTTSWEYGLISSTFWWVTRPFLLLIFAETSPGTAGPPNLSISYREVGNHGVPILDSLPALLREPGVPHDDPRWGQVREFRRGWLASPWFGYFNAARFPYIQHHLLGSLVYASRPQDGADLWFYHEQLGYFMTRPETFPNLFIGSRNRLEFLSDGGPAQILLKDPVTRQDLPYPP